MYRLSLRAAALPRMLATLLMALSYASTAEARWHCNTGITKGLPHEQFVIRATTEFFEGGKDLFHAFAMAESEKDADAASSVASALKRFEVSASSYEDAAKAFSDKLEQQLLIGTNALVSENAGIPNVRTKFDDIQKAFETQAPGAAMLRVCASMSREMIVALNEFESARGVTPLNEAMYTRLMNVWSATLSRGHMISRRFSSAQSGR